MKVSFKVETVRLETSDWTEIEEAEVFEFLGEEEKVFVVGSSNTTTSAINTTDTTNTGTSASNGEMYVKLRFYMLRVLLAYWLRN